MNTRSGAQRGDLILRFKVVLPARLSEEQARLPGDSFVFCALQSRGASWPRVTCSMLPCLYMLLPMISTIVGVRERIDIHTCVVNDGCAASDGGGNAGGAERHGCDRTSQSEGF